jgi:hypothetical protein
MLRSKKYNLLKHIGINDIFDTGTVEIINDECIENMDIRVTDNYHLIKELVLEPYILKLKDILLIHIKDELVKDFEFLYKKSRKYVFDIYETSHPDLKEESYIKMYHIFCVSKNIGDTNYIRFLEANDSDKKYHLLSLLYGPSILVNRRFDITSEVDKFNAKYKFLKTIGKGNVNTSLRGFINTMIKMTNEYQDTLPPHYLKIN